MKLCNLFSRLIGTRTDALSDDIIGYDHIKRLFRMMLDSDSAIHKLLDSAKTMFLTTHASAKTMFLTSLMHHLKNSYYTDGANSTKAGMIRYLFENVPKYLLIDEIDKLDPKDQAFLLNLMETATVTETSTVRPERPK